MNLRVQRVEAWRLTIALVGRFDASDEAVAGGFRKALGLDFPAVNRVVRAEGLAVFGVAPGKALVVVAQDQEWLPARLGPAFSVTDLTEARVLFEITGSDARAVVGKGTTFPVEDEGFDAAACSMARFAAVAVLIEPLERDRVRLHVPSSYAQHVEEWLRDAALEKISSTAVDKDERPAAKRSWLEG